MSWISLFPSKQRKNILKSTIVQLVILRVNMNEQGEATFFHFELPFREDQVREICQKYSNLANFGMETEHILPRAKREVK